VNGAGDPAVRPRFAASFGFELDDFQRRALDALDGGRSVLVAAPTGSGKTVVAEYGVEKALAAGGKAFYTTPLKALSNQKFHDLAARHGADRVGLLTGDNAVNGDAPIVVMTTEVLRNMIYAGSATLDSLHVVVLDEVHFLQDAYRGPVWEEVIIHAPRHVRLVCLSATVSNAAELAEWIGTVRGPTDVVVEERRPVELRNLYMVGDRGAPAAHLIPILVDGRANPQGERFDVEGPRDHRSRGRARPRFHTPSRLDVIERLDDERMLPAIYFIFSRAGCDDAARRALDAGVRLTTAEERARIREIVDERLAALTDIDLDVLGWPRWMGALEAGVAAHHAGMVPPFKEAVEACFAEGLVKVVFATETLALGINMPARSVVIERLTKFTGERHEFLTPGEYTQLTGRAGRRGIDELGYAVVLWSPFVTFERIAALAATRSFPLRSVFRPTYNMAANLVRSYPPETAHHLLNLSFAQYQADREVVRLEAALDRNAANVTEARSRTTCDRGDVAEYRRLLDARGGDRRRPARRDVHDALGRISPGDVLLLGDGRRDERAAVLSVQQRRHGTTRVRVVTARSKVRTLGPEDFDEPPEPVGHVDLPVPFLPNDPGFQRQVADAARRVRVGGRTLRRARDDDDDEPTPERHPVHSCPDREEHLRAIRHIGRLDRERESIERRVRGHTESLAREFDRVLQVLESWGYLDGWALTPAGERLVRIFHECDLLVAESIERGALDGLDPASLAGLVSVFTFEARGGMEAAPWFPSAELRRRWERIEELHDHLNDAERRGRIPVTRAPDPGFIALAHAWAAGDDLETVLAEEEISGGDFVRNVKQLIDLLRQVGEVAPDPATARAARQAADRVHRGVVAVSTQMAATEEE
jgi:ATP-dependent RNA helicase HelY